MKTPLRLLNDFFTFEAGGVKETDLDVAQAFFDP